MLLIAPRSSASLFALLISATAVSNPDAFLPRRGRPHCSPSLAPLATLCKPRLTLRLKKRPERHPASLALELQSIPQYFARLSEFLRHD
jgi:hypothetical protein